MICWKCFNEISAELIRRKVSSLNIPEISNDEKLPNVERLERYCPPDWNFLWGRV